MASTTPSHHPTSLCCGVLIDFYEICGHTLTLPDHSTTCIHSDSPEAAPPKSYFPINPFLDPPVPALIRQRQGLPATPRPTGENFYSPTRIAIDLEPQLKCQDLHRYIRLVPGSCICKHPLPLKDYPSLPTRSDPQHPILPRSIIFQRRMYWLQELTLEKSKAQAVRVAEWRAALQKCRDWEEEMRVPFLERIFLFDPKGKTGNFFMPVDICKVNEEDKTCAMCRGKMTQESIRILPCGCVLDLDCVAEWMRERKDCPVCMTAFRLVKIGSSHGMAKEGECDCPTWKDD